MHAMLFFAKLYDSKSTVNRFMVVLKYNAINHIEAKPELQRYKCVT